MTKTKWALAVHGGAGVIERSKLKPEQERAYREGLARAAQAGAEVLERGGSSLDAVEAAVKQFEEDPLFNAGRGSVFTAEGKTELDASVMEGRGLRAGAVAAVSRTRHPVSLARAVMERSPHVFLAGPDADAFAINVGLEAVEPGHFFTERRWKSVERFLEEEGLPKPERPAGAVADEAAGLAHDEGKYGTVGAVAVDRNGDVAAATSTGGTTGKRWGRIGDSPVIGAGTYASNASSAVSATGTGEYFIRLCVAHTVCALVELKGLDLQEAVDEVVKKRLVDIGGDGGVIAVDPRGRIAWSFNTEGMYRARIGEGRGVETGIFADEP